ncbi:XRE family transcriptional regulator [Streptomyces sp. NPDC058733]|uniref:XRE family transcriptional regulator n=1 Tax=unclassified Streptomyces TaxID=2593676 RepID=UPI0034543473
MTANGSQPAQAERYKYSTCAFEQCGRRFRQPQGPGRPRRYCQDACRRRAQRMRSRQRDKESAVVYAPRWGPGIAHRLQELAAELVDAENRNSDLAELVERAATVGAEVTHYLGAAVHDARLAGASWAEVARKARVSEATARARWGSTPLRRQLRRRARDAAVPNALPVETGGQQAAAPAEHRSRLGAAVSSLLRAQGRPAQTVAQEAGVSPSCVSRLMTGQRVPDWPVVFTLVTAAGGRPEEFRLLWEWARGHRQPSRRSMTAALTRFHGALLGLQWAAGRPRNTDDSALNAVLSGELVPDWGTTHQLVLRLGGIPEQVRPLWEDVQYTFLLAHDFFPEKGVHDAQDFT